MSQQETTDKLLAEHKEALNTYREWDEKVKIMLKGRRVNDLTPDDMESYREAADKRDAAYDKMRHLERSLLDNIPGAATGPFPAITPEDIERAKQKKQDASDNTASR